MSVPPLSLHSILQCIICSAVSTPHSPRLGRLLGAFTVQTGLSTANGGHGSSSALAIYRCNRCGIVFICLTTRVIASVIKRAYKPIRLFQSLLALHSTLCTNSATGHEAAREKWHGEVNYGTCLYRTELQENKETTTSTGGYTCGQRRLCSGSLVLLAWIRFCKFRGGETNRCSSRPLIAALNFSVCSI